MHTFTFKNFEKLNVLEAVVVFLMSGCADGPIRQLLFSILSQQSGGMG
jgi:hypothetical protein